VRFIGPGVAKSLKAVPFLAEDMKWADMIHCHFGHTGSLVLPWKLAKRKPMVVSYCGDDLLGRVGKKGRYCMEGALLAAVNSFTSNFIDYAIVQSKELLNRARSRKKKIVRYGTDTDHFREMDRDAAKEAAGLGGFEGKVIFFMGQKDVPVKNFRLFRDAMQFLHVDHKCLSLGNVGSGDMAQMMNASDVCVLTSLHEGSPNVIREAMACNRPIVSVDVGDVRELLEPVEGCFVTGHDPEEIASAIGKAFDFGRTEARERLLALGLDTEGTAGDVVDVYNEILKGRVI
jgi:glycosyltransferase involved in cell wall biosynthesis